MSNKDILKVKMMDEQEKLELRREIKDLKERKQAYRADYLSVKKFNKKYSKENTELGIENRHLREQIENLKKIKMGDDTDFMMDDCAENILKKRSARTERIGNNTH